MKEAVIFLNGVEVTRFEYSHVYTDRQLDFRHNGETLACFPLEYGFMSICKKDSLNQAFEDGLEQGKQSIK